MNTVDDVISYRHFSSLIDLGITIGLEDISFEEAVLYSWIKEELAK